MNISHISNANQGALRRFRPGNPSVRLIKNAVGETVRFSVGQDHDGVPIQHQSWLSSQYRTCVAEAPGVAAECRARRLENNRRKLATGHWRHRVIAAEVA